MSQPDDPNAETIPDEYRRALAECETLYHRAGLEITNSFPQLVEDSSEKFITRMLDLYRGLMIKIRQKLTKLKTSDVRVLAR
jgi:hypothetical protein